MSPTANHYVNNTWSSWRAAPNSDLASDLPTPPASVPPRRSKAFSSQHSAQAHEHPQHLTLPPIKQLDRHWECSSPLTPPDDDMHSSPLWRDSKPGPSRLHSPAGATSPMLASPSPSPIDDDDDRLDAMEDEQEAQEEFGAAPVRPEWEWQQQFEAEEAAAPALAPAYQEPSHHLADWVTSTQKRSAHFIAEKTCEMVCYLWFSGSLGPGPASTSRHRRERARRSDQQKGGASPPFAPLSNDRTATLQFNASPEFVSFMQKLLETTQVSQSVIVLSLHYIYRLKERNDFTLGKPGSEFRVAVCALMLANKFVDDNTYTNKTWSEVSGIALTELNKMEREFLLGVDFRLFVDEPTYESWLNLLVGLVLAKEREHQRWRARRRVPSLVLPGTTSTRSTHEHFAAAAAAGPTERRARRSQHDTTAYAAQPTPAQAQPRARSSSPHRSSYAYPFTFAVPPPAPAPYAQTSQVAFPTQAQSQPQTSPAAHLSVDTHNHTPQRPGSKRSAADAFSPTSATFAPVPTKRPTGLAVDIRAALASAHPAQQQQYPLNESLRGFERMSLDSAAASAMGSGAVTPVEGEVPQQHQHQQHQQQPHTLAAQFRPEEAQRRAPQNLYFYTLASSPTRNGNGVAEREEEGAEEDERECEAYPERKGRLKYSRAPAQGEAYGYGYSAAPAGYYAHGYGGYQQTYSYGAHQQQQQQQSTGHTSTSAYTQPQPAQPARQVQNLLPPLALALSAALPPAHSYVHAHAHTAYATPPAQRAAQSARTSPLPSFADVYGAYAAPGSTAYAAYSAPASETVEGVYAPHAHSHSAQHYTHPHIHAYKPTVPSPLAQQNAATTSTPSRVPSQAAPQSQSQGQAPYAYQYALPTPSSAHPAQPQPAPFANAGPPGVVHFYQPHASAYGIPHGGEVSPPSNVPQSQSVSASPYAYAYAARGRRY